MLHFATRPPAASGVAQASPWPKDLSLRWPEGPTYLSPAQGLPYATLQSSPAFGGLT
jgi:hypothetical protein